MKVGFIGLGNVGHKLSGSLLRNGVDLSVLDLNFDLVDAMVGKGAKAAANPAQLMRDCDAVITCLPSPAASDAVLRSMLNSCCMSGSIITTTHIPILPTVATKSAIIRRLQEYKLSCSFIKKPD